jgi:hypothetical protein
LQPRHFPSSSLPPPPTGATLVCRTRCTRSRHTTPIFGDPGSWIVGVAPLLASHRSHRSHHIPAALAPTHTHTHHAYPRDSVSSSSSNPSSSFSPYRRLGAQRRDQESSSARAPRLGVWLKPHPYTLWDPLASKVTDPTHPDRHRPTRRLLGRFSALLLTPPRRRIPSSPLRLSASPAPQSTPQRHRLYFLLPDTLGPGTLSHHCTWSHSSPRLRYHQSRGTPSATLGAR